MNIINLLHDNEGDMNIYSLQKSYFPRALINLKILKAPLLFELSQDLIKKKQKKLKSIVAKSVKKYHYLPFTLKQKNIHYILIL